MLFITLLPVFLIFVIQNTQNHNLNEVPLSSQEEINSYLSNNCIFDSNELESKLNDNNQSFKKATLYKDISVIPEFSNFKCLGSTTEVYYSQNDLILIKGVNKRLTNLVLLLSIPVFMYITLRERKLWIFSLTFFSCITFVSTILFFFSDQELLNYYLIIIFYLFICIYLFLYKRLSVLPIDVVSIIILPLFMYIQLSMFWLTSGWYFLLMYYSFYFLGRYRKNYSDRYFLFLVSLLSFTVNYGSFLTPLRDAEHWRQNQNALSAVTMAENGLNIYNPLPLFGSGSLVPFEVPFMQLLSAVIQKIGISSVYTLRPVSWLIFILFLYVTYFFVIKMDDSILAQTIVLFLVLHPTIYKFSNSYMIEFIPHLFGIFSLLLLDRKSFYSSRIFITLSLLSKITTGIIYLLFWLIVYVYRQNEGVKKFLASIVIIFTPNVVWNILADSVKESNALSAWLSSENLRIWNFASIEQYTDISIYRKIYSYVITNIWSYEFKYIGLVFLILIIIKKPIILIPLFIPAVFLNLYNVHEYYFLAVIPPLCYFVISSIHYSFKSKALSTLFVFGLLLNINLGLNKTTPINYRIADKVNFEIEKEEVLSSYLNKYEFKNTYLSSGVHSWSPIVFYEANKKGFMYLESFETLGNTKWDSSAIEDEEIALFVFEESYLKSEHLDRYLNNILQTTNYVKLEIYEDYFRGDQNFQQKFNYAIVSPYSLGEDYDILISKGTFGEVSEVCLETIVNLTSHMLSDIKQFLEGNSSYRFEINNDLPTKECNI
tara:strand:+ start:3543 stop:5855 length:2313 start_codon:yes stop_codon:yes gene_type:complete